MIQFNRKLVSEAKELWVACSGGPDSMAVVDFMRRGGWKVNLAYFHHGTEHGTEAEAFVTRYAADQGLHLSVGRLVGVKGQGDSPESFWRDQRYGFLHSLPGLVVTGHHLDDVAEWWIFSALRGNPGLTPWERQPNVVRPFLRTRRQEFMDWCVRRDIPYVLDPSNDHERYSRNYIRRELMARALVINPGLHSMLRKKLLTQREVCQCQDSDTLCST